MLTINYRTWHRTFAHLKQLSRELQLGNPCVFNYFCDNPCAEGEARRTRGSLLRDCSRIEFPEALNRSLQDRTLPLFINSRFSLRVGDFR
jgi:hypothetical protein